MTTSFAKVYTVCFLTFRFDAVFIYEVFLEHASFVPDNDNLMLFN